MFRPKTEYWCYIWAGAVQCSLSENIFTLKSVEFSSKVLIRTKMVYHCHIWAGAVQFLKIIYLILSRKTCFSIFPSLSYGRNPASLSQYHFHGKWLPFIHSTSSNCLELEHAIPLHLNFFNVSRNSTQTFSSKEITFYESDSCIGPSLNTSDLTSSNPWLVFIFLLILKIFTSYLFLFLSYLINLIQLTKWLISFVFFF